MFAVRLYSVLLLAVTALSMPYRVPLQGIVGGKRTLVLLDDMGKMLSFSQFFQDLSDRGHELSYFHVESQDLRLKRYRENLFDNIVLMAPSVEKFNTITFEDLTDFSSEGGNLLICVNRETSDAIRDYADSFGISIDKKGSEVIDHFNFEPSVDVSYQHTNILSGKVSNSAAVMGSEYLNAQNDPVLFRGIGLSLAENNVLGVKILSGSPSTYSSSPNKPIGESTENIGQDAILVGAVQARNNARIVVAGSVDMFSDLFFEAPIGDGKSMTGNRRFCAEFTKWAFGERGVLRFRDISHHKVDGSPPDVILHEKERPDLPFSLYPDPEIARNSLVYRIKDEIVYSMFVEQFTDGSWKPFPAEDMQMEFVMLDPYVRKTMTCDPDSGVCAATFTAPDSYGIFKFRVLYRRTGYSVLHAETCVSIRPFKHNEYERFIFSAFPYYSSALSASIAFMLFLFVFTFSSTGSKVVK